MRTKSRTARCAVVIIMLAGTAQAASAQRTPFVYPQQGQNAEQQQRDMLACLVWAGDETGFDPAQAADDLAEMPTQVEAPPAADTGSQGKRAARGAKRGTVTGVVTGSAVRGAVIGSTTSVLFGRRKQRKAERERAEWEQHQQELLDRDREQAEADYADGLADYNQALSVCMEARGYVVR